MAAEIDFESRADTNAILWAQIQDSYLSSQLKDQGNLTIEILDANDFPKLPVWFLSFRERWSNSRLVLDRPP